MTSYTSLACCPCCKVDTCLSGDTIDTGCCLGCDDLIMWSERPGWNISQRYFLKGNLTCSPPCNNCKGPCANNGCECGQDVPQTYRCIPEVECASELDPCPRLGCDPEANIGKIINYNVVAEELEPLQTVYRFYKTYWRPVGFYTGDYKVHNQKNTHRRALASQLPIAPDPIQDGEFINPGQYSRCKYETIDDWDRISWWNDVYVNTVVSSCLGQESPCAQAQCSELSSACLEEENDVYCGGFVLKPSHIFQDTKEGYENLDFPKVNSSVFGSSNNCCYPICADPPCTQVTNPPFCECDSYWMTRYRKRKLLDSYRYRWGVDIECYNNSLRNDTDAPVFKQSHNTNYTLTYDHNMGNVVVQNGKRIEPGHQTAADKFRLADHWLFNMHFERWWKIGKSENPDDPPQWWQSQSFWNIPEQSGIYPNPTTTQTNYPYQVDDLVPKWWIYACSGVPVFQFEVEDAYNPMNSGAQNPRAQVIDSSIYDLFEEYRQNAIFYAEYSLQSMWEKMASAGYFEAKDWREEQLLAYKQLNEKFPNAGYGEYANKTVEQMPLLGPYRKRYYADHETAKSFNMRKPYLRPDLVSESALHLQAECFIQYPGQWWSKNDTEETRQQKINDYYFWAERQWVYFRGVPAGWTWASWDAELTCPCYELCEGGQPAPNEDAAILAGCGRAKGNCIESWFNQPNVSYTTNNEDNWTCKKPNPSQECNDCAESKYLECLESCRGDSCNQCSDNYSQYQEECNSCWTTVNVPQCSVPEGASYSMTGASFVCNSPSCLNCCAACVKTDTTRIDFKINTIKQLNTQINGTISSFAGPAKFKIKYTFIPPDEAPVFGQTGSGSTGLVLNESYAPSVGTKLFFDGNFLSTNPYVQGIENLANPSANGLSNFEGWVITSSGFGFIEIEDTYDFLEGVLANVPLNGGALIVNGSTPSGPLGDGFVMEPTRYYCDDSENYEITVYDDAGIATQQQVDCEVYQNLVVGDMTCPKGLLIDTDGNVIEDPEQLENNTGSDPNCGCAATPLIGCPSDICLKLSVTGYCGGVHIIATQYATQNKIEYKTNCSNIKEPVNYIYRCLWTANTFLTPAKNFYEFNQNSKKCTGSTNNSMFSYWPEIKNSHVIPQKSMCNPHWLTQNEPCVSPQNEQYRNLTNITCASGICWPWWEEVECCGNTEDCGEAKEGNLYPEIGCLQRISCVSETHGKIWDGRNVCPPSCGTDSPSYSTYSKEGGYYGKDGLSGGPTESSCERNDFIGYVPSCDYKGRSVEVNS